MRFASEGTDLSDWPLKTRYILLTGTFHGFFRRESKCWYGRIAVFCHFLGSPVQKGRAFLRCCYLQASVDFILYTVCDSRPV